MIKHKRFEDLFLIPAAQTRDKMSVNPDDMVRVTNELREEFDYIINRLAGGHRARIPQRPGAS